MKEKIYLTPEEGKIALYNLEQLFNVLKILKREKQFMRDTIGTGSYWRWKRRGFYPTKKSLKKICDKIGIEVADFIRKKMNIKIEYKIEIEYQD